MVFRIENKPELNFLLKEECEIEIGLEHGFLTRDP